MQKLGITHAFNAVFGPFFGWLMQLVGLHPVHPNAPINDVFALEMLVVFILLAFFVLVRATLSVENPNPAQHVAEIIHEFVGGMGDQVIGHGYERFQAFVTCVLLFVLLNNLVGLFMGLVPGVVTPTSQPVVPLGIAVLTFLYYNFHGVRVQGPVGYIKHFMGPLPVAGAAHVPHRDRLAPRAHDVAHHPSLRQHVCQRPDGAGGFLAHPACASGRLPGPARDGFGDSGIRLHAAGHDLPVHGSGARALESRFELSFSSVGMRRVTDRRFT